MSKLTAILNFVFGVLFALVGTFALYRAIAFLSEAPPDQDGLVAWAIMIIGVGICLVIGGVRHVRLGTNQMQGPEVPEDS